MTSQKDHETMENLEKCFSIVQQSSAKGGIRAAEISKKLGWHKTTVYNYLNSLQYRGRVESQQGLWRAKSGEQTIQPSEKEIVIKLPLPKNEWQRMVLLENAAKTFGGTNDPENIFKISLDKLEETRTIRIIGKNVDDLDLKKISDLIQQADIKNSKVDLRSILKNLKRRRLNNTTSNGENPSLKDN